MSHYYVYAYLNPLEPGKFTATNFSFLYKPFYIGKGKGNRLYDHLKDARPSRKYKNTHKLNTIRQIIKAGVQPIIIKLHTHLSENEALFIEQSLIKQLKESCGLTNIRTSSWRTVPSATTRKTFNNPRKNTITVYNHVLNEHAIIKSSQLEMFKEIFGESNITNTTSIPTRIGTKKNMARIGSSNGMYGKSAVKGKKWCIVEGKELFLSPEEIDNYIALNYNITYGRTYKPKGKRIIFEGELKGKYRTDADIDQSPDIKYQYGLVWNNTKPTYINHELI
jgi:hypothetical protein